MVPSFSTAQATDWRTGAQEGRGGVEDRKKALEYRERALKALEQVCGEKYVMAVSLHKVDSPSAGRASTGRKGITQGCAIILTTAFNADAVRPRTLFHLSKVNVDLNENESATRLLDEV